jgi:uncharacterized protein DUF4129
VPSAVETLRRRMTRQVGTLALAALLASTSAASAADSAQPQGKPTDAQVKAAVAKLAQDPNLGRMEKAHRLHWKSQTEDEPPPDKRGAAWLEWVAGALSWFAATARALLWVIGIVLAGVIGLYIKRFLELRGVGPSRKPLAMPTHVRDLDIRPESLPDDIGASALRIWEQGEHRTALALLYRGALSRLAHVHGVPIRDASTEGDCLRLANAHLLTQPAAYVGRLIRVWQRAVYGNADPTDDEMRALCGAFAEALDKSVSAPVVQAA